ncbi:OHCU decarboxylase [Carnimonas sp. R-84981]|uniref:2-oxo-4-hydroxy-4-carboxy-5-ureidoimidazoline decarboxylase n=1 Tax=Carnimonas bestiolae TaxID=3402172 RepID=UPI003EDC40F7
MIALDHFNHLPRAKAQPLIAPCVAIPGWIDALLKHRPYSNHAALMDFANKLTQQWGEAELEQALSAHPRIGEQPGGNQAHAALSRQEQSAVDQHDARLAEQLREGNARYEARFGRVFLIRAKGRSGEEILQALTQRLDHGDAEEVTESLQQLREITLLRLAGVIGE